jgi:SAM-dependent methyltransferase
MLDSRSAERKYADFYSLYTADFKQDVPIYLELAAKHLGPVLEVGCAAGRVTAQLAGAGYQVVGIDTSRPMLEVASRALERWASRASIADFDLRQSPLSERFGVALVTLYTFNALIDVEEQRRFLRHLVRSLKPDAAVAFDLFCPAWLVRGTAASQWREIERTVEGRRLHVRDRREMLTPLLERRIQVFRIDDGPETEMVTHRRYLPPEHAAALLTEAGFEDVVCVRDYDLAGAAPVGGDAPRGPFMLIGRV